MSVIASSSRKVTVAVWSASPSRAVKRAFSTAGRTATTKANACIATSSGTTSACATNVY